jgi:hypothetical protein
MSHWCTTSVAQEGGTTTGSTWTGDGERRQAGPFVEFALALRWNCRQRQVGFLTPRATHVPPAMRIEASSSCPSARTSSKLFNKRWRDWTWAGCVERGWWIIWEAPGKELERARSANEASFYMLWYSMGGFLGTLLCGLAWQVLGWWDVLALCLIAISVSFASLLTLCA